MEVTSLDADLARALVLLSDSDGSEASAQQALALARTCVDRDTTRPETHAVLARALVRCRRSDEAVRVCKNALVKHPGHVQLEAELRAARFAVLNEIDSDDDSNQEHDEVRGFTRDTPGQQHDEYVTPASDAPPPITEAFGSDVPSHEERISSRGATDVLAFEAKVEKLLLHLDLNKLMRVGAWYTLLELLQLRNVTAGFVALFLGLLAQAIMHRHKFMVISMLVVGLAHSQLRIATERYLNNWIHTSTDKLGAVVWLPRVAVTLPIVLKIVGHLRFMLFLQRDLVLSLLVTGTTTACVLAAATIKDEAHPLKAWGYGKRLKFVAYATATIYWVLWQGNYSDSLRLLGPALIDAGGILLSSTTPPEMQGVCRRAWKRVFDEVALDVQQDVDFDAWFLLGLTKWGIDYWQQPTTISLEMIVASLSDAFATFENHAVHLFRPELHRLAQQMKRFGRDAEFALLVEYLKASLERVPPPKWLGFLGLATKRCASYVVAIILLVFHGTVALPIFPFMASEAADVCALYKLYYSEDLQRMDGLDVLLLGSPLLRVWQNAKATVYCLEGGVTLSTAVATGAQIATAAVRLGQLATFAAKVKTAGFAAHADELPDQLTSLFVVLSDYSSIADGVRRVYDSTHVQDLGTSLRRWWTSEKQE